MSLTNGSLQICLQTSGKTSENEKIIVMTATVSIILDKRRMQKKSGTYPIKLQIIYKSSPKHFQTVYNLSLENYEKLASPRLGPHLQFLKNQLKVLQRNAEDFIKEMEEFSFYIFEKNFIIGNQLFKPRKEIKEPVTPNIPDIFDFSPYYLRFPILKEDHSRPGAISRVYLSYTKQLLQQGRIGTALNIRESYNSIIKFKGNVLFTEITISYLYQYELWMKNMGLSRTTTGIRIRALRTIFNEAIETGIIKREKCYPFGKRKYIIPTGRNIKKALDINEISAVYYYEPECPDEIKAKDFWLFCYFGNGMNPKDVANLKFKNIQNNFIVFVRSKTERTTRQDPKPITVFITEDLQRIIDRYANKDKSPNNYVFPILEPGLSPMEEYELVPQFTKFINHRMNLIGKRLGIDRKITTIVSRHSFSTQLKRSGVSTEFIQEALGHTDKKTTENYLGSFSNDTKREYAEMLSSFKMPGDKASPNHSKGLE